MINLFYSASNEQLQHMTMYVTNAVFALRTTRNWTNYYETCRSGIISTNKLVSTGAKADMRNDPLLRDAFNNPYIRPPRELNFIID